MSKRGADKQLTHDNWDAEDSGGEEAGQFQTASEDVLKGRVIKKARRRVNRADDSGAAPSPFAAFSGFKAPTAKPAGGADNPFGFLAAAAAKSSPAAEKSAGSEASKAFSPAALPSTPATKAGSASGASTPANMSSPVLTRPPLRSAGSGSGSGSAEYHRQLQALNRSMLSWLQEHVDKNPLCILTPVFRDYETHLASIERRFDPATATSAASSATTDSGSAAAAEKTTPASTGVMFFGDAMRAPTDAASPPKSSGFSFGVAAAKPADSKPATGGFSFGLPQGKVGLTSSAAPAATTGFSFGLSTPADKKADSTPAAAPASTAGFSFGFTSGSQGGGAAPAAASTEDPEESEEPPVPVVNTVKEDDAVYSKKCKLFYKKDGSFVEKGVGMLYLKPCSDEKFQCLIRADTNLGNILLNIKLSKSIPTQRMGKNNVMMACVPNPPLDPKRSEPETSPVPLLIRVKTGDDADELLRQIDDHKR